MGYKCWVCGKEASETRRVVFNGTFRENVEMSEYVRCYCSECKAERDRIEKEERETYIKLKKREMFYRALEILEGQHTLMYDYKDAIDVVKNHIEEHPDKFDSSYEVLAAIILVHNRIYSKMQYKVGPYQVDFLLPELFVVLEIDGDRHVHRKDYDKKRDTEIKQILGGGWEIIRIKTDYLDMNAGRLPKAIDRVIDYREKGKVNWREI